MKRVNGTGLWIMICLSLFIHGLFFFVFNKNKKEEPPAAPFKMEWLDSPSTSKVEASGKKSRGAGQSKKKAAEEALQSALRTDWLSMASSLKAQTETGGLATELGDVDVAASGVQVSIEKTLRDDLELPLLWKQIRVALRYRPEHAMARINGDVQVRIRVDRFGKLLRIFEEGATGPDQLVGWTILCLLEAFREPFLKKPMQAPRTLDLRVQYTVGRQVLPSQKKSARMLFVVEGDLYTGSDNEQQTPAPKGHLQPPDHPYRIPNEIIILVISTKQVMDTFRDKTLKNHLEWDYYTQREYYRDQCHRHLNQQACQKLQELTKLVGTY